MANSPMANVRMRGFHLRQDVSTLAKERSIQALDVHASSTSGSEKGARDLRNRWRIESAGQAAQEIHIDRLFEMSRAAVGW